VSLDSDSDETFKSLSILTKNAVYIASFSQFSNLERVFLFPVLLAWSHNFNVQYSTWIDDYLIFAFARAIWISPNLKNPWFVLRIHKELLINRWCVETSNALAELKRDCNIEAMLTRAHRCLPLWFLIDLGLLLLMMQSRTMTFWRSMQMTIWISREKSTTRKYRLGNTTKFFKRRRSNKQQLLVLSALLF
jgi:hypothetical protein